MFIDYSDYERKEFLAETQTYFLPGYTGHCPTLKYQIGKRYGSSTKEIIQTLRRNGVIRGSKSATAGHSCHEHPKTSDFSQRQYILGYTGYIPGMYQHYGQSFRQIAEKCENKRNMRAVSFEKKLHPSNIPCTDYNSRRHYTIKASRSPGQLTIY